ncbi:MAG: type II toxin-antitoxin system VapC family toxin [Opitutaceae bacterium]
MYNVVDSSGWLEIADSPVAGHFSDALEDPERLIVPVITICEVFKKVLREKGEGEALQVASLMQSGTVVNLDQDLALEAARYSLPLADSIILATAVAHEAVLWTQDVHFQNLPNVRYFPKE